MASARYFLVQLAKNHEKTICLDAYICKLTLGPRFADLGRNFRVIVKELNEQLTSLTALQLILCLLTLSSEFLSMSLANFLDLTARLRNLRSDQS